MEVRAGRGVCDDLLFVSAVAGGKGKAENNPPLLKCHNRKTRWSRPAKTQAVCPIFGSMVSAALISLLARPSLKAAKSERWRQPRHTADFGKWAAFARSRGEYMPGPELRDATLHYELTTRIVVIDGGFDGLTLAQRLERLTGKETEIVLLSGENHLVFSPLLAETVGREISPLHVIVPGRQMVRRTRWLTARATEVDWAASQVHYVSSGGERGVLSFDHLVVACGSVVDLSAVPGLAAYAYPLKTLGDATFLGNDLIGRLEEAAVKSDPVERRRLLTVVVIGGGFSGVEGAGAINDLLARALPFYPQLYGERVRIIFLQRGDRILPELHAEFLSEFAVRKLRARGIDVRLHVDASEVSAGSVLLKTGERIETDTVICTVGNATNPFVKALGLPLERGRLKTEPDM